MHLQQQQPELYALRSFIEFSRIYNHNCNFLFCLVLLNCQQHMELKYFLLWLGFRAFTTLTMSVWTLLLFIECSCICNNKLNMMGLFIVLPCKHLQQQQQLAFYLLLYFHVFATTTTTTTTTTTKAYFFLFILVIEFLCKTLLKNIYEFCACRSWISYCNLNCFQK